MYVVRVSLGKGQTAGEHHRSSSIPVSAGPPHPYDEHHSGCTSERHLSMQPPLHDVHAHPPAPAHCDDDDAGTWEGSTAGRDKSEPAATWALRDEGRGGYIRSAVGLFLLVFAATACAFTAAVARGRGASSGVPPSGSVRHSLVHTFSPLTKEAQPGVLRLHSHNYHRIASLRPTFVMFTAPGCSFCSSMEPIWQDLAVLLHEIRVPVQVAQLDLGASGDIGAFYGVTSVPYMALVSEGKVLASRHGTATLATLLRLIGEGLHGRSL
eukprot:jgi/Mesen1/10483/ME000083S09990